MERKRTQWLWLLGIAVFSVLLLLCTTGFAPEMFLYDDNRNQWMPVMDKAYEQFFSTGIMPNYDFFQSKGLEIADEGYYGLHNPLMMLCYVIYHFVFLRQWGSTISFYILFLFLLGNLMAFLVGRQLKLSEYKSVLLVLLYASCSAFYMFAHWYYIFNNYFLIPLLLYVMLRWRDNRLSYIACGIVLAFSLLMGNVQYTIYHYCLYALLMLGMALFHERKYFLPLLSNCALGLTLSVPHLMLLMQSSSRSPVYTTAANALQNCLQMEDGLLGIFIPYGLCGGSFGEALKYVFGNAVMERSTLFLMYAGGFGICLYGIVLMVSVRLVRGYRTLKTKSDEEVKTLFKGCFHQTYIRGFYIGVGIAMAFFFLMMTANIVGRLMVVLPVFKNLRFLFKGYFVFLPLCLVPAAVFLKKLRRKSLYVLLSLSVAVGFANNYFVAEDSANAYAFQIDGLYTTETAALEQELENKGIDRSNYRMCSFVDKDTFNIINKVIRNVPTTVNVVTLNAYDFTTSEKAFDQSNAIMPDLLDTLYSNTAYYSLLRKWEKDPALFASAEQQLIDNAVKYLIVDQSQTEPVTDAIAKMETVKIKKIFPFMKDCHVIELDGIAPLCSVPLQVSMDSLHFDVAPQINTYRLAFTYQERLRADYVSSDGSTAKQLPVFEDENGYLLVKTNGLSDGTVTITYTNTWIVLANIASCIVTLLFIGLFLLFFRKIP